MHTKHEYQSFSPASRYGHITTSVWPVTTRGLKPHLNIYISGSTKIERQFYFDKCKNLMELYLLH